MVSLQEQQVVNRLQANWVWIPNWIDSSPQNTAGRIVSFTRDLTLSSPPIHAILHVSADTRYKLYVNGVRAAVGPTRSSPLIWYYDTLDLAPYLQVGHNTITFRVLRYFASSRGAMPFERTAMPGLTVAGSIQTESETVDLDSGEEWTAVVDESVQFPTGLIDDVFLHIYERITPTPSPPTVRPRAYGMNTVNGELPPWRLKPRLIPMYEESSVSVATVRSCQSPVSIRDWEVSLSQGTPLALMAGSSHTLELQADVHSTAFLKWTFQADKPSSVRLKVTYSEGYEEEPRSYPFFRAKKDRLDAANGHLIGPFDEVQLDLPASEVVTYEPFWFRTFRVLRVEISVGSSAVTLAGLEATQVNYPLAVKASWTHPGDLESEQMWDVSIRTMRNCMFDGYSDCPFYEQLQYSGDSRSVGLFHYLLSGDDRLMRQAITNFAASITPEGLTQSRFPSHSPQLIAGFPLFWILQVTDHHLFFGDSQYARSFLPRVDGVLEFFHAHIDSRGLVAGLPEDVWQYVDWVTTWGATETHPDKGVPTAGRDSNTHTYFSLLYAYVLQKAADLVRAVGRPGYASEYEARAQSVKEAIRTHCYDGRFFTDSTVDVSNGEDRYSQHCQVFAVLSGTAQPEDSVRLLTESVAAEDPRFAKCSYMMKFYVLRAFALAGENLYNSYWGQVWTPWRKMLKDNLTTWEEDDVRQRSDCHAWGSVPVYEFCTELAGISPIAPGCSKVRFQPRLALSETLTASVALGRDNVARVSWETRKEMVYVKLSLEKAVDVVSRMPAGVEEEHGVVDRLEFVVPV